MRPIKFRAWDKGADYLDDFKPRMVYDIERTYDTDVSSFGTYLNDQERYEVMQFTGLHDKNGKEIYEGDVVRDTFFTSIPSRTTTEKDWHWEIYFDTDEGRFWARKPGEVLGEFNCDDDPAYPRWHDYEVIGNIFENPDLLK